MTLTGSDDLPSMRLWLVVVRGVRDSELKFFVSNVSKFTLMVMLLRVAFQQWWAERCFENQKQQVGLGCYEGRRYFWLKGYSIVTSLSYLFPSKNL